MLLKVREVKTVHQVNRVKTAAEEQSVRPALPVQRDRRASLDFAEVMVRQVNLAHEDQRAKSVHPEIVAKEALRDHQAK